MNVTIFNAFCPKFIFFNAFLMDFFSSAIIRE